MGGRAARTDPMFGNVYDHFAVEYEYPNGARVLRMCRQTAGAAENVSERVVGTKGLPYADGADGYICGLRLTSSGRKLISSRLNFSNIKNRVNMVYM